MSSPEKDDRAEGADAGTARAPNLIERIADEIKRHGLYYLAGFVVALPTCWAAINFVYRERMEAKAEKISQLEKDLDSMGKALKQCQPQPESAKNNQNSSESAAASIPTPAPSPAPVNSPTPNPSPTAPPADTARVSIRITKIPASSPGGPASLVEIAGVVTGVDPRQFRVVLYSYTSTWYVQPDTESPLTRLQPDGSWSARIKGGRSYAAILVRAGFDPPDAANTIPGDLGDEIITFQVVDGR